MPETHLLSLQRTLAMYREEKRRVESELADLEKYATQCRKQLLAFERMIASATTAVENCFGEDARPHPRARLRIVRGDESTK